MKQRKIKGEKEPGRSATRLRSEVFLNQARKENPSLAATTNGLQNDRNIPQISRQPF
ncbi:hypothetical protein OIU77_005768 [Salix suchowensis]|uniref:Uncharacterized protein n=2 Tax=Salix TaxID=40685 RepID=A0A9Q0W1V0_9ROSI|nr:hypothetical protein OIU77_005768 [Salix suchowensis]KAJ6759155.1 hypothetical protein OIU74_025761 [Salix koriyanagi]